MSLESYRRILLISAAYQPDTGGVATHVANLAHGLIHTKLFSVYILTAAKDENPSNQYNGPLVIWKRPQKQVLNFYGRRAPLEDIISFAIGKWTEMSPDIIHAHDFDSLIVGGILKAIFKRPLIVTIHRVPRPLKAKGYIEEPKDGFIEAIKTFNLADAIVVPSRASCEVLQDQGFKKRKLHIVAHGIDASYLAAYPDNESVLNDLQLSENQKLIICPVRADVHKDPWTFIRGAGILKNLKPDLKFLLTCDSSEYWYRSLCSEAATSNLNLGSDIIFRSFEREAMPTLYRKASVCVVPSRRESFGQTVLEAFVFGAPVVVANATALKELVQHGQNGLLFTDYDPHDLARQVSRVLEEEGLANRLKEGGTKALEEKYTLARMVAEYRALYEKIIE